MIPVFSFFHTTLLRNALGLLITAVFLLHASGVFKLPFVEMWEHQAYDLRLNLTTQSSVDPRIVIVDIDEKSLAREGRWPWGRDRLALLMDNLFDYYHVNIVGFDVLFAEEDHSSGLQVLQSLARGPLRNNADFLRNLDRLRPQLERDRVFAASLKDRPVVLGYYFKNASSYDDATTTTGMLPPPATTAPQETSAGIPFVRATGYGGNLALLQRNALGAGFIDMPLVDRDGVIRRMLMLQQYQGKLYPAFPLAMVQAMLGSPPIEAVVAPGYEHSDVNLGLEWLDVGGYRIPVDERAAALIPYRGAFPQFSYVSAVDVLDQKLDPKTLESAIVLVGTTSAGLLDMRATPVQNVYPGVEIHANMIAGILDETIRQKPGYTHGAEFTLLFALGITLTLLLPRLSLIWTAAISGLALLAAVGGSTYAWVHWKLDLPMASQILLIFALFVLHVSYGFFIEKRGKRKLTRLFGQYVPPELVDEMSNSDGDFGLSGEVRNMTVLFCDIRGFTAISENLDPRQLTQLINLYFTEMTRVIHQHRGTIDKYMGDAIMAFWGAPLRDEGHARHALAAAVDMIKALPNIQRQCEAHGWPPIRVGIGINSGPMNVGNMGSQFRVSYTVLGDAVNVASRLENLTKRYSVPVIVSETTKELADNFVYRELDTVRVEGKDTLVRIFEPIGMAEELNRVEPEKGGGRNVLHLISDPGHVHATHPRSSPR